MANLAESQNPVFDLATRAARTLRNRLPNNLHHPVVAIVCGSGLANLQNTLKKEPRIVVPFGEIDGMPHPSVAGHEGKLVFGYLKVEAGKEDVPLVLSVGRTHFYEGHSMSSVTYATRLCRCLNVKIMIITNAAGGLNPTYNTGDIVLLHDHINLAGLAGQHPLRGPNENDFGVRFPALSDAYDLDLRRRAHDAWRSMSVPTSRNLHEGVYAFVSGPTYETRAECRMLRLLGADLVGMSTVPEVIVGRHCGLRILALSLVTNKAVLDVAPLGNERALIGLSEAELEEYQSRGKANHEEVLEEGRVAAEVMQELIANIIDNLAAG